MTDLHIMAQQILAESKYIETPEYRDKLELKLIDGNSIFSDDIVISPNKVEADEIIPEYSWNGFVPDIAFKVGDKELFIEIAVTHFIEDEKRKAVIKANVAMIEIDLSSLHIEDLFDKEKFTESILYPKELAKWVNNPKGETLKKQSLDALRLLQDKENSKLQAEKKKKLRIEESKKKAEKIQQNSIKKKKLEERNKLEPYLTLLHESVSSKWKKARNKELSKLLTKNTHIQDWQSTLDIEPLVGVYAKEDWIINTNRAIWQTFIIDTLLNDFKNTLWTPNDIKRVVVKSFGIIDFMSKLNIAKQEQKQKSRSEGKAYNDYRCWYLDYTENNNIISPFSPVSSYINYLSGVGFIKKRGEQYIALYSDLDTNAVSIIEARKNFIRNKEDWAERVMRHEQARSEESEEEVRLREEYKQDLRNKINKRISLLIAADERLYQDGAGKGHKCNHCQMALLKTDSTCPFCGCHEKTCYEVTLSDLKTVKSRYKCDTKPQVSVEAKQSLDTSCLKLEGS